MAMDSARINALYAQNAALRSKVNALEGTVVRDQSWVPPNVDRDLLYDEPYVNAVYNPRPDDDGGDDDDWPGFFGTIWIFIKWCFMFCVVVVALIIIVSILRHVFFVKRWNY